jgi:hypothetical protein
MKTVSAEKVENVVNPPQNPVIMASLMTSGTKAWWRVMVMKIPMRNPPSRLAHRVPRGMVGKRELRVRPNHHLSQAPQAAATPIAIKGYIIHPSLHNKAFYERGRMRPS